MSVLVVHAENDLQSEAASRKYADASPNAEFKIIENSDHFPFTEQPKAFSKVVGEFLQSHLGNSAASED